MTLIERGQPRDHGVEWSGLQLHAYAASIGLGAAQGAVETVLAGHPIEELPVDEATGAIAVRSAVPRDAPAWLVETLESMVALVIGHRAHSALDVLARLDRGAQGRPRASHRTDRARDGTPPGPSERGGTSTPHARRPLAQTAAAAAVAVVALALGVGSFHILRAKSPPTRASASGQAAPPVSASVASTAISTPSAPVPSASLTRDCRAGKTPGCLALAESAVAASPPDYVTALEAYRLGCDGGDARACNGIAAMYDTGTGVAESASRGFAFYTKACNKGDPHGCYQLARDLQGGRGTLKDDAHAFALYKFSCDKDDGPSCNSVGWSYILARGTSKNVPLGSAALQHSCDAHDPGGCDSYAFALLNGEGAPRDEAKAKRLFEQACSDSVGESCMFAGFMSLFGRATTKSEATAQDLFSRGCATAGPDREEKRCQRTQVEPEECGLAGLELSLGTCGPADKARAAPLLAKACGDGWSWACDRLK